MNSFKDELESLKDRLDLVEQIVSPGVIESSTLALDDHEHTIIGGVKEAVSYLENIKKDSILAKFYNNYGEVEEIWRESFVDTLSPDEIQELVHSSLDALEDLAQNLQEIEELKGYVELSPKDLASNVEKVQTLWNSTLQDEIRADCIRFTELMSDCNDYVRLNLTSLIKCLKFSLLSTRP